MFNFICFPFTNFFSLFFFLIRSDANALGVLLKGRIQSISSNGAKQKIVAPALVGLSTIVKEPQHTRKLVSIDVHTSVLLIPTPLLRELETLDRDAYAVLLVIALRSLYYRQQHEKLLFNAGSFRQNPGSPNQF
jgi:hypothetical protein